MESVAFPRFFFYSDFSIRFWCIVKRIMIEAIFEKYLHLISKDVFVDLRQEVLIAAWRHDFLALLLLRRIFTRIKKTSSPCIGYNLHEFLLYPSIDWATNEFHLLKS